MISVKTEFDISAVSNLVGTLSGIAEDVRADVLADMVAEGAKPVLRSIKSKVPVRYGNLKKSITSVVRKNKRAGTALAVIGPEVGGRFRGGKKLNKKKDDLSDSEQPSRYAHLVEFGHKSRDGSSVNPKPFMRPGTNEAREACAIMMIGGFQKGMTKALRKHVKKISKQ